jgi:hypothetical protein
MNGSIDIGGVISRTFEIYVDQASVLMPAAAVVFVFSGLLTILLIAAAPALTVLALIISLIAVTLFTGMVVKLVADVQDGRRDASAGQLLQAVTPVLGQLILVAVVAGIVEGIGFLLLIVPGLILVTIWSVAAPVVVLERPGGLQALGRSRELVRGNGWQAFGVILILVIGVAVLGGVVDVLAGAAGTAVGLVVRVIVGVLTAPISALAAAVLYFDLRGVSAGETSADVSPPGTVPPAVP